MYDRWLIGIVVDAKNASAGVADVGAITGVVAAAHGSDDEPKLVDHHYRANSCPRYEMHITSITNGDACRFALP